MSKKISLGFSSCPNDTFIFDALVHQKIDWKGLDFEFIIADVEELNQLALNEAIDVSKVSYYTYLKQSNKYDLLNSGGALGFGVGPLLIAKQNFLPQEYNTLKVAIPGINTTANLLLSLLHPEVQNKTAVLFSEIEDLVMNGQFDAGLIIHENRFTYQMRGLHKLMDLGEKWEKTTNSPIPLGGIIAKNNLEQIILHQIQELVRDSVQFAFDNPKSSFTFVRHHAVSMEKEVMLKHIGLYVNDFSLSLEQRGEDAINHLFEQAYKANLINELNKPRIIK